MLHFDSVRYLLHAWVVMPNHVHALCTPKAGSTLAGILHSWKSFTAKEANRILGRNGHFWQEEYFDRYIRNQEHYWTAVDYIEMNPVRQALVHARRIGHSLAPGERVEAESAGVSPASLTGP